MPKIVTDTERLAVRNEIYIATIQLIRQKGLKKVTVDDITNAVSISKGAFYQYYNSKELCLFDVIKRAEADLFLRVSEKLQMSGTLSERVQAATWEAYLGPDSITLFISPEDIKWLFRKLPAEAMDAKQVVVQDYFEAICALLGFDATQYDAAVFGYLIDSLHFLTTQPATVPASRDAALVLLLEAVVNYLLAGVDEGVVV